jgi:hypothetical protein
VVFRGQKKGKKERKRQKKGNAVKNGLPFAVYCQKINFHAGRF